MRIPFALKVLTMHIVNAFRKARVANICGHPTKRSGLLFKDGVTNLTKMPIARNGGFDYCIKCIEKMATRCTTCHHPIFVGDYVSLGFYSQDNTVATICAGCVDTIADLNGHWMPPGVVQGFPSALELCVASGGATRVELS